MPRGSHIFLTHTDDASKILSYFNKNDDPNIVEWILWISLFLLPFFSYFYADTASILKYEVNFTGSIVNGGGLRNFYEYSRQLVENGGPNGGGSYATYDFPMYILLGIWGIPLWTFYGSKGLTVTDYFIAKIYGKSIYLVAVFACAYLIYSICQNIKISKVHSRWASYLFCSSLLIYTAVAINGQSDILGITFILLGLRSYIRNEKIRTILFFMVACTFKMYALFIFVPLLLIREKNLLKIGISTLLVISFKTLCSLPFDPDSPALLIKKGFEQGMYRRLTANKLPLMNGATVPVTILLLGMVCIYCYLRSKPEDQEELNRLAIWIPLLSLSALFISFESSSYWYLHLAPYLAILMVYNSKNRLCMLFETGAIACLTLGNYGTREWAYEIFGYNHMLIAKLLKNHSLRELPYSLGNFCIDRSIVEYSGALYCGYIILLLTFLWQCSPKKTQYDESAPIRPYAWLRLIVNTAICYIPLCIYVYDLLQG